MHQIRVTTLLIKDIAIVAFSDLQQLPGPPHDRLPRRQGQLRSDHPGVPQRRLGGTGGRGKWRRGGRRRHPWKGDQRKPHVRVEDHTVVCVLPNLRGQWVPVQDDAVCRQVSFSKNFIHLFVLFSVLSTF